MSLLQLFDVRACTLAPDYFFRGLLLLLVGVFATDGVDGCGARWCSWDASSLGCCIGLCPLNRAAACDIHAERLLAKVGGSKLQGEGDLPPLKRSEAGVERAERSGGLHKRSAEAWGNPLRARGAELLSVLSTSVTKQTGDMVYSEARRLRNRIVLIRRGAASDCSRESSRGGRIGETRIFLRAFTRSWRRLSVQREVISSR